jgi:hypothetical protein
MELGTDNDYRRQFGARSVFRGLVRSRRGATSHWQTYPPGRNVSISTILCTIGCLCTFDYRSTRVG